MNPGEWTPETVMDLASLSTKSGDSFKIIADAHNAAVAAEKAKTEQNRLEIWRKAPDQPDIQEAVIAKLDLVHRHAIEKALADEREKVHDDGYEECRALWKKEAQTLVELLESIANERPVQERAAAAFYRVRQKSKEMLAKVKEGKQ